MPADIFLSPGMKGLPHDLAVIDRSAVPSKRWNVLADDLPLPVAVLKRTSLEHNIRWMQDFVVSREIDFAPHGKTTMSPELFGKQLDAGAWGITFANVTQLLVGIRAGVERALIANQVFAPNDLQAIQSLLSEDPNRRIVFLVDSTSQLDLIQTWFERHTPSAPFDVMLEIGLLNARTGCRTTDEARNLARQLHSSSAVRLVGIECYEGLGVKGCTECDGPHSTNLMDRVEALARFCDSEGLYDGEEVIISAGGSSIFDLVAGRLRPTLARPVRGLLRSGCYITHDHGHCARMGAAIQNRLGYQDFLQPALEVWAYVQSVPEPGLAIVSVGRRDISFDIEMPIPIKRAKTGSRAIEAVPATWKVVSLNDQHGYLRWQPEDQGEAPVVGDKIGLGISHPCTTFDKWQWMPIVNDDYDVVDAITTNF